MQCATGSTHKELRRAQTTGSQRKRGSFFRSFSCAKHETRCSLCARVCGSERAENERAENERADSERRQRMRPTTNESKAEQERAFCRRRSGAGQAAEAAPILMPAKKKRPIYVADWLAPLDSNYQRWLPLCTAGLWTIKRFHRLARDVSLLFAERALAAGDARVCVCVRAVRSRRRQPRRKAAVA